MRVKTCALCGKSFVLTVGYKYKIIHNHNTYTYCGYTCYRTVQNQIKETGEIKNAKK